MSKSIFVGPVSRLRPEALSSFSSLKGSESSSSCSPAGGSTGFTPLESPAACSGDEPRKTSGLLRGEDIIPFGANTGFKAPREPSRWKVRDLLTGFT